MLSSKYLTWRVNHDAKPVNLDAPLSYNTLHHASSIVLENWITYLTVHLSSAAVACALGAAILSVAARMLYDLNVPWFPTMPSAELERMFSFLAELGYSTIALNHFISPPLPSALSNPIPVFDTQISAKGLNILRRGTLVLSDPTVNYRLSHFSAIYDLVAIRPTTEKALLAACTTISSHEFSLISLDLSIRYPFHFKPKPFMAAVNRGVRFEICYGQGLGGSSATRTTFLGNVAALIRATGGRGLVISSEAKSVLGVRGMEDIRNLAVIWGISGDKAGESVSVNPRGVVVNEAIRRSSHRGVIDIVDNGALKSTTEDEATKPVKANDDRGARMKKKRKIEKDGIIVAKE